MIELNDKILGIWYIQLTEDSDWLLLMSEEEDHYAISYRFRYYEDDQAFDSKDRKNWYSGTVAKGPDINATMLVTKQRMAFEILKSASMGEGTELIRGEGSFKDFKDQFMELPFVNYKEMSKEEAEEKYPDEN